MKGRSLSIALAALMIGLLAAYVVLHSPLRARIDQFLFGECTVFCNLPPVLGPLSDAAAALGLIVAAGVGAWTLSARLVADPLERLVAWSLVAYGFLVVPAALLAFAGDVVGVALLRPPSGPLLAALPAVLAVAWSWGRGWRPVRPRPTLPPLSPFLVLLVLLFAGAVLLRLGVSMAHPPTGFDDLGYHAPLAVLFWQEGSLSSFLERFEGTFALSHPGGAELWQGLLMLVGGEPLAVTGQLPFGLMGAAGVALFARRLGLRQGAALAGALLFLLAPMVLEQSGHLRNDLVGAAVVIAVAAIVAAPRAHWTTERLALVGLGLGLMAVTKLALLAAVAALGLVAVAVVVAWWRSGRDRQPLLRGVAVGLVLLGLVVGPWWIRNTLEEGNPIYPSDIPLIGRGAVGPSPPEDQFVPDRSLWLLYPLFEPHRDNSGVGAALAVAILPALFGAARRARRWPLIVLLVLAAFSLAAWWFLDRREPRFLLGLVGLVYALVPFALIVFPRGWRDAAAGIIGAAAVFSVAVTMSTSLSIQATRPTERTRFYDEMWKVDPAAVLLPVEEALLLDDQCPRGFQDRLYPFLGVTGGRHVGRIDCAERTTAEVERQLRRLGARHVYVLADPADLERALAPYTADRFELLSRSTSRSGGAGRLERLLYRWVTPGSDAPP